MMTRIPFQTAMRAAAVQLLKDYAESQELILQVYPGRPRSLYPPTAFVDRMRERTDYTAQLRQRFPEAEVVIVHGIYDTAETVAKRDAFMDNFLDWVTDNVHAAGANTTVALIGFEDEPGFVPDWLSVQEQKVYYATVLTLRGLHMSG